MCPCALAMIKFYLILPVVTLLIILFISNNHQRIDQHDVITEEVVQYPMIGKNALSSPETTGSIDIKDVILEGKAERRFPGAIIIGAKKCGTTALRQILSHHPLIETAKNELKFFSERYSRGISWYIAQMPLTKKGQLTIEKTPKYFVSKVAPQRIKNISKDVKLILIVRNPLSRSVSDHYFIRRRLGQTDASMNASYTKTVLCNTNEINNRSSQISVSMYDIHYSQWLQWFPKEQILIVNGDNLKFNPVEELTNIEKFLNIPHYFENDMFNVTVDESSGRSHWYWKDTESESQHVGKQHKLPYILESTLHEVAVFLQPHASRFCQMASINVTWCTDMLNR